MQKLKDELQRSFIVVVKDYFEVAGFGESIGHEMIPLINRRFGKQPFSHVLRLEQSKNRVTSPARDKWRTFHRIVIVSNSSPPGPFIP